MPRPPRIEYPGAVYHVMARGDGGMNIFDTDDDRNALLDLMMQLHDSHGWKTHAYVLMGNHFHILLETPEANLVDGMRWMMGVFALGWNRRSKRRGHVFQGRYKSIPVDAGNRTDGYFKVVADYIHLNPARTGWVGASTGKKLGSYRWSSFNFYDKRKAPAWISTTRVMEEFSLSDDRRGRRSYAAYLEKRALSNDLTLDQGTFKVLRRGWFLGSQDFGKSLLKLVPNSLRKPKRESLSGEPVRLHDEHAAAKRADKALVALDLPKDSGKLRGHGKFMDEKALVASLLRQLTKVSNAWIAERLGYSSSPTVSRAVARVRDSKSLQRRLRKLREMSI